MMTRRLLAATCLTPIGLALSAPALADTTISTSTTANVSTSTANNGAPDNVVISSTGAVNPAAGTAVTINSNNNVTNAGGINTTGIDNVIGIGGGGGFTSNIVSSGTITLSESYTQTDTNGDGVLDGPFAQGTGRYGIYVSGSGPLAGTINNSGAITIKGNNSGGIVSDVGITGDVISSGSVSVTGDNSYGIRLGTVGGKVTIAGGSSATGQNSVGVALNGDVGGQVVIHGAITSTGYTSTTLPASTTSLTSDNLKQGGSALIVGGNIGGGLLIAGATTTTDTTVDADNDGIVDTNESAGSIVSTGSAPAVLIGSATQAVTLGPVGGGTAGLVINGSVSGSGVYAGVDGNGVQIGGLGQPVTISGGATVGGTITAASNGANATAFRVASGASLPSLTITGSIGASSTTTTGGTATAIQIDAGASLPTIANSGTLSATPATSSSNAYVIRDQSGTLTSVTNTGTINATASASNTVAIDASANTSGFSYAQSQSATSGAAAPALTGAILTGSGNDTISASAGTISSTLTTGAGNDTVALSGSAAFTGATTFGDGNDSLTLAGTSNYSGSVQFGAGADTLTVADTAVFNGQLLNSGANVAVSVQGGTLNFTNTNAVSIGSLNVSSGTIGVAIDPAAGTHTEIDVLGNTTISGPSTIKVTLSSFVTGATNSFTVLKSGTLTGSSNLGVSIVGLPYLLTGSLSTSDTTGTVAVSIERKTAAALGLLRSEAAAYDAVYADIAGNTQLTNLFLGFTDRASLIERYRQMLPDHAGGVFDLLYTGARNMAPSESVTPWTRLGGLSLWAQQGFWSANQDAVNTPGYKGSGYGASVGGDVGLGGVGRVGLTFGYTFADIKDPTASSVTANQFNAGAYWRGDWGGLHLAASGGGGIVTLDSRRALSSTDANLPTLLSNKGKWHGFEIQGSGRASYEAHLGAFYARPAGTISYFRLHENSHSEEGGGSAYDLIVAPRVSDELAATGTMALGVKLGGGKDAESTTVSFELEGGRREVINSAIGATTAHFAGGQDFTLEPEGRDSGYVGSASLSVGSQLFRFVASANAEKRDGYHTIVGRVGLRGLF